VNKNLIYTFIFLLASINVMAAGSRNNLIYIGGGGEPRGESTIFDLTTDLFTDFYKTTNWKNTTVSFNGGHDKSEEIAKKMNGKNTPFTDDQYTKIINSYSEKINSGEIAEGEKLMIVIDSHGAAKIGSETTHKISTSGENSLDLNNLRGGSTVSLTDLQVLTNLAKKKNIKLAIIDMSCHSGNALELANSNTCVITSTGTNHYAYAGNESDATFAAKFMQKLQNGKNLEQVFLEAREETRDDSFPMISSSQNQIIKDVIYNLIGPYLYSFDESNDKLLPYLIANSTDIKYCERETAFTRLNSLINKIEQMNTVTHKFFLMNKTEKNVNLIYLKNAINEYKEIQDLQIKKLKKLNSSNLNEEFTIQSNLGNGTNLKQTFKAHELLTTDFDKWIRNAYDNIRNEKSQSYNRQLINLYENCKKKAAELVKNDPSLTDFKGVIQNYDKGIARSKELAGQIATEEKKLYNAFYRGNAKYLTESNPCRDFTL
jgi:hypothetical protein